MEEMLKKRPEEGAAASKPSRLLSLCTTWKLSEPCPLGGGHLMEASLYRYD